MENQKIVDDYLANRLTPEQRAVFEQQVAADPALRNEVALQQTIVNGIRAARATELKNMLRNTVIQAEMRSFSGNPVFRIAASMAGIGLLLAASVYYIRSGPTAPADTLGTDIAKHLSPALPVESAPEKQATGTAPGLRNVEVREPQKTSQAQQVNPIQKPELAPADPSREFAEQSAPDHPGPSTEGRQGISRADVTVTVNRTHQKFQFHYQFEQGALRLFGPFDNGLFEILEIQGETRNLFLFYQANYYGLSEEQSQVTRLEAVSNPDLLRLLKAYHRN